MDDVLVGGVSFVGGALVDDVLVGNSICRCGGGGFDTGGGAIAGV